MQRGNAKGRGHPYFITERNSMMFVVSLSSFEVAAFYRYGSHDHRLYAGLPAKTADISVLCPGIYGWAP